MIYERIKALADERGVSIASIEREVGLGNATIKGWKESSPSANNLKKVADYFGVSIEYFLTEEKEEA